MQHTDDHTTRAAHGTECTDNTECAEGSDTDRDTAPVAGPAIHDGAADTDDNKDSAGKDNRDNDSGVGGTGTEACSAESNDFRVGQAETESAGSKMSVAARMRVNVGDSAEKIAGIAGPVRERVSLLPLPAERIAVLKPLPSETDIRMRWDVPTGWAALAAADPSGGGPRFLGFAKLVASCQVYECRVVQVLESLEAAGFQVVADFGEMQPRLRETWIRFRDGGGGSGAAPQSAPLVGAV